jgi:hypothetical protein
VTAQSCRQVGKRKLRKEIKDRRAHEEEYERGGKTKKTYVRWKGVNKGR